MSTRFRVKALYEYTSPHEDDLNFDVGQIITITEAEDDDWYTGEYIDDHGVKKEGIFPRNFVEKFEPTAPPRPARSRPKATQPEDAQQPQASFAERAPPSHDPEPEPQLEPEPEPRPEPRPEPEPGHESEDTRETGHEEAQRAVPVVPVPVASKEVAEPEPAFPKSSSAAASPPTVRKAAETSASKFKPGPPPVFEKPSSFKDRIAAFNKAAAPPVAPFTPGGLGGVAGGTNFVKKPFVAPPPSRNAYVPPTREKPTTSLYRREEDPEIKEREAHNLEQAERAGLVPTEQQGREGADDDQPKPTSLKERIALLQKQQMEQAQRHAEAAARKEKPKKPQKKKPEATVPTEQGTGVGEGPSLPALERTTTAETEPRRTSTDDTQTRVPSLPRRRASKGPAEKEVHDGNEADMSGAGDTTEGQDDTTEREDSEDVSRYARRIPTTSTAATNEDRNEGEEAGERQQQEADDEEEEEEEEGEDQEAEEQDDMDPEVRRKEELRARMAKMSGGMGFHGMFGAPVPPVPSKALPKKKMAKSVDPSPSAENDAEMQTSRAQPPPIPTAMALPGMGHLIASSRGYQGKGKEVHDDVDVEDNGVDDDDGAENDGHGATLIPFRDAPPPVPAHAPVGKDGADDTDEDQDYHAATTPAAVIEASCACDVPPPQKDAPYQANFNTSPSSCCQRTSANSWRSGDPSSCTH
ncbi:hypothetical protein E4U43_005389 [Claviceps pusilla]|uniref:SH3 domain-containing protein n=1 Tax=Claviceps pusilla TaxID=123648 RepID=A0A9P7SVI1_9HYPO|nr:hypothetical protein E4U43_005389 [Claviceps pusilla]